MINHYRTALLNIDGSNWPGLEFPGEELVDPAFVAKPLTGSIGTAYRLLFGEKPERAYLNYRLRQITTMWHDSVLHEAALDKDKRITYWPLKFSADMSGYGTITVDPINSWSSPEYKVFGVPEADDKAGRSLFIYDAVIDSGSCVVKDEYNGRTFTAPNLGGYFSFGNNIKIALGNGHYRIEAVGLPQKDIGQVLADCEAVFANELSVLLFKDKQSLNQLWRRSEFLPDKLGALSLAVAMELDKESLIRKAQAQP